MHMSLYETLLDERGFHDVKQAAFRALLEKVQTYVDLSLRLRSRDEVRERFRGLPPTILGPTGEPLGTRTAAIDQQRQLHAAAHAILVDPQYGQRAVGGQAVIEHLIQWHDAFVENFVVGDRVRGSVDFDPGGPDKKEPDPRAHRRRPNAIEGSASLARALHDAANRRSAPERGNGTRRKPKQYSAWCSRSATASRQSSRTQRRRGGTFSLPRASPMSGSVGLSTTTCRAT